MGTRKAQSIFIARLVDGCVHLSRMEESSRFQLRSTGDFPSLRVHANDFPFLDEKRNTHCQARF